MYEEYLKNILTPLLDSSEDLKISSIEDELGILLSFEIAKSDIPRVIGKNGATIQGIRTLLRVYGGKNEKRVNVKMLED